MKKRYLALLFVLLFSLSILMLFTHSAPYVRANPDDLEYKFESDILYSNDTGQFPVNETFNLRNSTKYEGHYNATYSFENDVIGSEPEGWITNEDSDCSNTIIDWLDGHTKVLQCYDNSIEGNYDIYTSLENQTSKTIEFWWRVSTITVSHEGVIYLQEGDDNRIIFRAENGQFSYHNGVGWQDEKVMVANQWYHHRVTWDDATNTFDWYINNILEGNDISYYSNSITCLNWLKFYSSSLDSDFSQYFDAIGYSWDENYFKPDIEYKSELILANNDVGINQWTPMGGSGEHYTRIIDESDDTFLKAVDTNIDDKEQFNFETIQFDGRVNVTNVNVWMRTYGLVETPDVKIRWNSGAWSEPIIIECSIIIGGYNHNFENIGSISQSEMDDFQVELDSNTIPESEEIRVYEMKVCINYSIIKYFSGNLIPYAEINTSIKEIDKFEFAYDIYGNLYESEADSQRWNEIDTDNYVYIENKIINIRHLDNVELGIYKDDFNKNDGIFNLSIFISSILLNTENAYYNLSLYSYDETEIIRIHIIKEGSNWNVYYWNGVSNIFLFDLYLIGQTDLILSLYYAEFVYFSIEKTIKQDVYIPFIEYKKGLSKIEIIGYTPAETDSTKLRIDSIGVYCNGTSLAIDFSVMDCKLPEWNSYKYNLLTFNIIGNYSLTTSEDYEEPIIIMNYSEVINEVFINLYSIESFIIKKNPVFSIITNQTLLLNYIKIEGVKLTEGVNTYWLEFGYENVEIKESYFYVVGNRLYFTLNVNKPDDLETINASFNIENVYSTSRSIAFHSDFNGDSIGVLGVNYLGEKSRFFVFPNRPDVVNVVLHQGKTIDRFTVYITDNNYNYTYGVSTGYISNIRLVYLPEIEFTMLTTTLITMMIPIMIILIPTIAIYARFGKDLVVPMIILMSIICFVGNLIPAELFFIIMFGCSIFIVESYRRRD